MTLEDYYLPGPPYGPGKKPIVGFNRIALAVLLRGSAFLVSTFRRGSEWEREKVGKEDVERERGGKRGRKIKHQQKTGYSVFDTSAMQWERGQDGVQFY